MFNENASLSPKTLLMGGGHKKGLGLRGQYGEGMKISWLGLWWIGLERAQAQYGKEKFRFAEELNECDLPDILSIYVRNNDERWIPKVEWSSTYSSNIMVIDARQLPYSSKAGRVEREPGVEVKISGLTEEDWKEIQSKCLDLQDNVAAIDLPSGRILLAPEMKGKLYCRGLFVGDLPDDDYQYGYDLFEITLDRDRRLADPYSIRLRITDLVKQWTIQDVAETKEAGHEAQASMVGKMMYKALTRPNSGEALAFREADGGAGEFHEHMAQHFFATHGESAFPLAHEASLEDEEEVRAAGYLPIKVEYGMAQIIRKVRGLDINKLKNSVEVLRVDPELSEECVENGRKASGLFREIPFEVVTFKGSLTKYNAEPKIPQISINMLSDLPELIRVLAKIRATRLGLTSENVLILKLLDVLDAHNQSGESVP